MKMQTIASSRRIYALQGYKEYKNYNDYKVNKINNLLFNNQDKIIKDVTLAIENDNKHDNK